MNFLNQIETHEKLILDLNKSEKNLMVSWEDTKKELSGKVLYKYSYIYVYKDIYLYVYVYITVWLCTNVCILNMSIYIHTYIYVCLYSWFICLYAYIFHSS
jgi:hypothetical protein